MCFKISAMKKFYSIEYIDSDGDMVIKHAIMDDAEAKELLQRMVGEGVEGKIYDLSQQQEGLPELPVISDHEEK